jgi:hypothetical protein
MAPAFPGILLLEDIKRTINGSSIGQGAFPAPARHARPHLSIIVVHMLRRCPCWTVTRADACDWRQQRCAASLRGLISPLKVQVARLAWIVRTLLAIERVPPHSIALAKGTEHSARQPKGLTHQFPETWRLPPQGITCLDGPWPVRW